ncbi:MAG: glycosyltransferase family 2 protein [Chthoniobacterales bacterium]
MSTLPLISIVTPSLNQGHFLAETLQSLLDQNYPNLEVIIQDGGSTDDSIAVAERFVARDAKTFRLYAEKDRGQAHALNLGFAKARGEILGFLNSDDTLFPGALHSVARAIDPMAGRFVVFGRCLFTGEDSPYVGVEHPSEFESRFEHLAIWTRGHNTIPQPSVFWHRRVWDLCGGLNEAETHVLDYDLFCRFSRRFHFHRVDELWSTYRMHSVSKSAQRTEAEVLEMSIAASRRNWPPFWHPLHWRLALSYWNYQRHTHERARHSARLAEKARAEGRRWQAAVLTGRTFVYSPAMAWRRLLLPPLRASGLDWLEALVWSTKGSADTFVGRYPDGWIGPVYHERISVAAEAHTLRVTLRHVRGAGSRGRSVSVELFLNGRRREKRTVGLDGPFKMETSLGSLRGKSCLLELRVRPYFVPSDREGEDNRKLTVQLVGVEVVAA